MAHWKYKLLVLSFNGGTKKPVRSWYAINQINTECNFYKEYHYYFDNG